jgi:hypothetical protein
MNNETQHGYLVLADISGYTCFLAGVELTHAREMIKAGLPPGAPLYRPCRNTSMDSRGLPLRSE